MNTGTAAKLKRVDETFTPIPKPEDEPGKVLDASGHTFPNRGRGSLIMAHLEKEVTLRKGTVWLIGIGTALVALVPTFVTLLIVIGGLLIGYGRTDQSNAQTANEVQAMKESQQRFEERLEKRLDEIQKTMHQTEIKKSYQMGEEAAKTGKH